MLLQNLFLGSQAPEGEPGTEMRRGGSQVLGLCCTGGYFQVSSPKWFPLFPLPEAQCRHGENGKEKKID